MFHVKHTLAVLALACAANAHAGNVGGNMGVGHGMRSGPHGNTSANAGAAASQSGANGGRYSAFDQYQPWPQAEMQQYAKPAFHIYEGK